MNTTTGRPLALADSICPRSRSLNAMPERYRRRSSAGGEGDDHSAWWGGPHE
jgi:hypothetical protein